MSAPKEVQKAYLVKIKWDKNNENPTVIGKKVIVQFNPQTLKVSYTNQLSGGDKNGAASKQFVGRGTTKLSLDLWFDVTAQASNSSNEKVDDVRLLTKKIVDFMKPREMTKVKDQFIPPGVRFVWGSFKFEGVIDSINENLEFFSEEGKPLRASIALSIGSQEIQFKKAAVKSGPNTPGTSPLHQTEEDENMPEIASKNGISDWKSLAMSLGIENPRNIRPGTLLDLNIAIKPELNIKAGVKK